MTDVSQPTRSFDDSSPWIRALSLVPDLGFWVGCPVLPVVSGATWRDSVVVGLFLGRDQVDRLQFFFEAS